MSECEKKGNERMMGSISAFSGASQSSVEDFSSSEMARQLFLEELDLFQVYKYCDYIVSLYCNFIFE